MIAARITSIQVVATPSGDRLYAVFKTTRQGKEMGIWLQPGHLNLKNMHVGDWVLLQRNSSGYLRLALAPLPHLTQLKLFSCLNRGLRLVNGNIKD